MMLLVCLFWALSAGFTIASVGLNDSVGLLQFIFSAQNLQGQRKVISNPTLTNMINSCVNAGGDLAGRVLNLDNNANELTKLYSFANELDSLRSGLRNRSSQLESIAGKLLSARADMALVNADPFGESLDQLNRLSNAHDNQTYQVACSSNTYDFWVTQNSDCLAKSEGSACLVLQEYDLNSFRARYQNAPAGCNSSIAYGSMQDALNSYYKSLSSFLSENMNLISRLNLEYTELSEEYSHLANTLLKNLDLLVPILSHLKAAFDPLANGGDLFEFLNCCKLLYIAFLRDDLNFIIWELEEVFARGSSSLGYNLAALASFITLMVFFDLIVLLRYYRPPPLKDMWKEDQAYHKAEENSEREDLEDRTENKRFKNTKLRKEDFETNSKLKNIEESLCEAK